MTANTEVREASPDDLISISVGGSTHTRKASEWLDLARAALSAPELAAPAAEVRELDPWAQLLAAWEDEHGTIAAIMPEEYEALMVKVRELAVEYSPRMAREAALANGAPTGREVDACPHAAPFVYCEECKADPCPLGLGPEPVIDVGATLIAQRRRDYLFRNTPRCPACDGEQVQCVDWMRVPSWWRCRECQHGFDYEPADPSPAPEPAAPKSPSGAGWLIYFDDHARQPEIFTGEGAEASAKQRFEELRANWSVRLFSTAPASGSDLERTCWLVRSLGGEGPPQHVICYTHEEVRQAFATLIWGDPKDADPGELDGLMEDFTDGSHWSADGTRWEHRFEIDGLEVTLLDPHQAIRQLQEG